MRIPASRVLLRVLGASALALVASAGDRAATGDWTGTWQGGIRDGFEWYPARVELRESEGEVRGRIDVRALGAKDMPVELIAAEGKVVLALELEGLSASELTGSLADGVLRGASGDDWSSPAFQLMKVASVDAADLAACTGWYEIDPGVDVLITPGSEGGLRFFAGGTGGTLIPLARDRFAVAYKDAQASPPSIAIRFVRAGSGAVESLEFDDGEEKVLARRLRDPGKYLEPIEFRNADVRLSGLLFTPAASKPAPALVFIGGTGYSTADRSYELSMLETFLEKGIAVLYFDKRGCGRSGGNWRTSTLADLADDALAAAHALMARKEIDAKCVGFWGVSEGGWIAPLAASKDPRIAFFVDHGGPAVSPLEDELDDLTAGIRSVGFSGDDLEIAMALARALVDFYRSHDALPSFEAVLEAAKSRPWWSRFQARIPQREEDWRVQWWRKRGEHDSGATWKAVRVPALVLIGAEDSTMDRPKNLALYESMRASNPQIELRVVPAADHGLRAGGKIVDGVLESASDWILARCQGKPSSLRAR